jgi:hypothetical protein
MSEVHPSEIQPTTEELLLMFSGGIRETEAEPTSSSYKKNAQDNREAAAFMNNVSIAQEREKKRLEGLKAARERKKQLKQQQQDNGEVNHT